MVFKIVWCIYTEDQPLWKVKYSLTVLEISYNLYDYIFHCRAAVVYISSCTYVYVH